MKLDYVEKTGCFTIVLPRSAGTDIQAMMREHGLDFSTTASNSETACLFTREPYAAVSFADYATERARAQLGSLLTEIEASWRNESGSHIACPADKELWGFQKADIDYALRRDHTLVGDQPGLGKTPVAICYANEIQAKRTLVVCPANIRLQWVSKIREWTTLRWPYHVHPILNGKHGVHPTAEWTVVSYDLLRTEPIGKALARGEYDLLVLDEAHYLKTPDSRRTQAMFGGSRTPLFEPIASRAKRTLALTGTPLPNRPREAFTLAKSLCWDSIDWMSEDGFKTRFNPSIVMERVDPVTGRTSRYVDERTGRHAELQNRLRANFMARHLKREVMTQLKMPIYDLIQLEETQSVKQALFAESMLDIDPENLQGADVAVLGHIAVVRRLMGIALAPQVAEYVKMLIDGGEEKLVLFAWHIEVLNILQEKLASLGVVRIDGSTPAKTKQRLVDEFQANPRIQICLGNIQSMGTGTDGLQHVSCHALIAEPSWTPGENQQAFDRLDRGGQQRQVQADIFVAPNSFAERILASALRKMQTVHKALDRRL